MNTTLKNILIFAATVTGLILIWNWFKNNQAATTAAAAPTTMSLDQYTQKPTLTTADLSGMSDAAYNQMMAIIFSGQYTTAGTGETYPIEPGITVPYSSPADFATPVQQRIDGTVDTQAQNQINGVVYAPGALLDTYETIGGHQYTVQLTNIFYQFRDDVNRISQ